MNSSSIIYSVVVPVFNEEAVIEQTCLRLRTVMERLGEPYELIIVNDGSRDGTQWIVERLCHKNRGIKLVNLSRNFGHQIAISAGIDEAVGQAVIVIDADLQDPPEVIPEMAAQWKAGYDVVYGRRVHRRGETWFKRMTAGLFYRVLRRLTPLDLPLDTGDFRLMDRKVCEVLSGLKEKSRYVRGLVSWIGCRQTAVDYVREPRAAGETKYPLRKMLRFALDGIVSFSYQPLRVATYAGFLLSLGSFAYLIIVLAQRLFTETTAIGWASIVALLLFFNGIVLLILGIIGEYVGRIYEESKGRPLYVVQNRVEYEAKSERISDRKSDRKPAVAVVE